MDEERAIQILNEAEFGILSIVRPVHEFGGRLNAGGYGLPLNFVFDGDNIWFHCATEGSKLKYLDENPYVSFCVVGRTNPVPSQFTTGYESVIVVGESEIVTEDGARAKALELLVRKYSPEFIEKGLHYITKSFERTFVIRLAIESVSGKMKNHF